MEPAIGWNFDNSYGKLPERFYQRLSPLVPANPQPVVLNLPLAGSLGLDEDAFKRSGWRDLVGVRVPTGADPLAQAYAGHQFGHLNILGDGRALLLGEQMDPQGRRWDIQLKGSGPTRYSRGGDGLAALGPMLREYLMSEAMFALGVPTTRSLAVVLTGESVARERVQPGAILARVASSHLRVGTFEYLALREDEAGLRIFLDYALRRHDPDIGESGRALDFLIRVVDRQIDLISRWMEVGFIHGVMNTDNMTVSGETIDYGPCAFMDHYDPATVFSSIDRRGRYAYGNQPRIAQWNLARLAEALLPMMGDDRALAIREAEQVIESFERKFESRWVSGMGRKMGLVDANLQDLSLITDFLNLMGRHGADYTNTFRSLANEQPFEAGLESDPETATWRARWRGRLGRQARSLSETQTLMKSANPRIIPRNHLVERALREAESGDLTFFFQLLDVVSHPFDENESDEEWTRKPPRDESYRTFCGT